MSREEWLKTNTPPEWGQCLELLKIDNGQLELLRNLVYSFLKGQGYWKPKVAAPKKKGRKPVNEKLVTSEQVSSNQNTGGFAAWNNVPYPWNCFYNPQMGGAPYFFNPSLGSNMNPMNNSNMSHIPNMMNPVNGVNQFGGGFAPNFVPHHANNWNGVNNENIK